MKVAQSPRSEKSEGHCTSLDFIVESNYRKGWQAENANETCLPQRQTNLALDRVLSQPRLG